MPTSNMKTYSREVWRSGRIMARDLNSLVGERLSFRERELMEEYLLMRLSEMESAVRNPRLNSTR